MPLYGVASSRYLSAAGTELALARLHSRGGAWRSVNWRDRLTNGTLNFGGVGGERLQDGARLPAICAQMEDMMTLTTSHVVFI